jgi:hypothetical protein
MKSAAASPSPARSVALRTCSPPPWAPLYVAPWSELELTRTRLDLAPRRFLARGQAPSWRDPVGVKLPRVITYMANRSWSSVVAPSTPLPPRAWPEVEVPPRCCLSAWPKVELPLRRRVHARSEVELPPRLTWKAWGERVAMGERESSDGECIGTRTSGTPCAPYHDITIRNKFSSNRNNFT